MNTHRFCIFFLLFCSVTALTNKKWIFDFKGKNPSFPIYIHKKTKLTFMVANRGDYEWNCIRETCSTSQSPGIWKVATHQHMEMAIADGLAELMPELSTNVSGGTSFWTSTGDQKKEFAAMFHYQNGKASIAMQGILSDDEPTIYPVISVSEQKI